jgi:DNA-binding NarL/FixJ family response regulator
VIKIVLGEQLRLVREGIREVIGGLADGLKVIPTVGRLKPGVLVLPGLNDIEVTRQVRRPTPGTRVVVLSRRLRRRDKAGER